MPEEHGNGTAGALTGLGAVPSPHRGLPIPPRSPLLPLWHPRSKLVAGHSFSWRSEGLLCLQSRHGKSLFASHKGCKGGSVALQSN